MTLRLVPAILLLATLFPATVRAGEIPADRSRWDWAIGPTVGIPQTLGLAVEKTATSWFRVQGHAGTVLVVTSVGIRAIVLPSDDWVVQPYLFGGIGTFVATALDDDFDGVIPYAWSGLGLRIALDRFVIYGELSGITDDENEFGGPLPAAGILFQFQN